MESERILLSDKHFHDIRISEQTIGVITHALNVLATAFSLEPQYYQLIDETGLQMNAALDGPAIKVE